MRPYRHVTIATLVAVLLVPRSGLAWTSTSRDYGAAYSSVTLPDGDVVIGYGTFTWGLGTSGRTSVVRFAAETGKIVWRITLPGYSPTLASGAGGTLYAVAGGSSETCDAAWRIDPATGAVVWQAGFPSAVDERCLTLLDIALDSAGNPVVSGYEQGVAGSGLVVKLDAVTGAELWRHYHQPGTQSRPKLDARGDVYLGISGTLGTLIKLDGTTGVELARYSLTGGLLQSYRPVTLATDVTGNVFVAGANASRQGVVTKLDPSTGSEVWRKEFGFQFADAVAVDAAGDAYVYGSSHTSYPFFSAFDVVKLSGTDGSVVWQTALPGVEEEDRIYASGIAIALDSETNEVVVADEAAGVTRLRAESGLVTRQGRPMVYLVGTFSLGGGGRITVTGGGVVVHFSHRLAGRSLRFVDPPANPAGRSLRVSTTDALTLGSQASAATDPRRFGALLTVRNPDSGESASFPLPAGYWSTSGSSFPSYWGTSGSSFRPGPGEPRWAYRDTGRTAGPCKSVIIRDGKGIKIACSGSGIPAFLDEPSQGRLEISLKLGTGNGQCMLFGGDVLADRPGAFIAQDAPRPAACLAATTP
jgi:outer membrane protein assembly factor BamB